MEKARARSRGLRRFRIARRATLPVTRSDVATRPSARRQAQLLCAASRTHGSPAAETRSHDFVWRVSRFGLPRIALQAAERPVPQRRSDFDHSQRGMSCCDSIVVVVLSDDGEAVLDCGGGNQRVGELDHALNPGGPAVRH